MILEKLQEIFEENIPETLYMHPTELRARFGGSLKLWESFLNKSEVQTMIEVQMAKFLEIESRKALQKFSQGGINSQEISGLREILNNSKLLQERANVRPTVIMTYLPKKERENATTTL